MNQVTKVLKTVGMETNKHLPEILTGLAAAGVIGTGVSSAKAMHETDQVIKNEEPEDKKELIKMTWKYWITPAAMGAGTIACIIGADLIHLNRNAAIAGLAAISAEALKEYQGKVLDAVGEKEERKIRDEVAKEKLKKHPVDNKEVILTGKGDYLCYDVFSDRYFRSDIEHIRRIQNNLNHVMRSEMYLSLNDLYYALGLKTVPYGDEFGWNVDSPIEFDFSTQLAEKTEEPCLVIDYGYTGGPFQNYKTMW